MRGECVGVGGSAWGLVVGFSDITQTGRQIPNSGCPPDKGTLALVMCKTVGLVSH
jgi:hypothetical protein